MMSVGLTVREMTPSTYYYRCSPDYVNLLGGSMHDEILQLVGSLPRRQTQSAINADLFWQLTSRGWSYDTVLQETGAKPPVELGIKADLAEIKGRNNRDLCLTSILAQ